MRPERWFTVTDYRDADTPPRFLDPRRTGALIGLAGACVFVFSYADGVGTSVGVAAKVAVTALVAATVLFLYVMPRWLGPFKRPAPVAIMIYLGCVCGEIALIALGSRWLTDAGQAYLRPALIAAIVGLHFLPFAWAFGERMFYVLGGALVVAGGSGLIIGSESAALLAATCSGLIMAALVLAYALGAFAREPQARNAVRASHVSSRPGRR